MARQATITAWVESRPPETPITACLTPVASSRLAKPWIWML